MSEVKYRLAAGTNVGLIRKNNEDNFVVCPDISTSDWRIPQVSDYADLGPFGALLVVADGMGGANAGEVASAIAVETVQDSFSPDRLQDVIANDKSVQEFMKEVVKAADLRIYNRGRNDSSTRGMGTTIVMAWILGNRAYICWCGDSRCYMLNREKGIIRLSKDHSYVQELIDRGELDPEFAMDHPLSNVITRCLGDTNNRAVPETRIVQLHDGDTILLCSDGLSGLCSDPQLLDLLITFREDPEECKNELISAALNEGGHDNVTVALCNIKMTSETEAVVSAEETTTPSAPEVVIDQKEELSATLPTGKTRRKSKKGKKSIWLLPSILILGVLAFFVAKHFIPDNKNDGIITGDSIINSVQENNTGVINDSQKGEKTTHSSDEEMRETIIEEIKAEDESTQEEVSEQENPASDDVKSTSNEVKSTLNDMKSAQNVTIDSVFSITSDNKKDTTKTNILK